MKPDAYFPYYGNDFEAATKGFRSETKWAYLCAPTVTLGDLPHD